MTRINSPHSRILAISPSTRGFGYAVLETADTLVDWGVKSVKGDKNAQCLAKVEELIAHYSPGVLVLPDVTVINTRRASRIRLLGDQIIALASMYNLRVPVFSAEQVKKTFFADCEGTKYGIAEILAKRFPEELGFRLPPKRRPWMSEDYRMDIFDAVALALVYRLKKEKRNGSPRPALK